MRGLVVSFFAALSLLAASPAVSAFDGFSDAPGSHLESLRAALVSVYHAPASEPSLVKTMPIYGIKTYRWEVYRAADLMSDAARDTDSFFFAEKYAYRHAQTRDFPYKKELAPEAVRGIEEKALFDYVGHMSRSLDRVRILFATAEGDADRLREACYLLGVLIHSYQDLWAHRGITNGMHKALLKREGLDVDHDESRVLEMRERLASWLSELPTILGEKAGPVFLSYLLSGEIISPPSIAERGRLLNQRRDIFVQGIIFTLVTTDSKDCLRYRREIEWDVDSLDTILHDGAALAAAARCATPAELSVFLISRDYRL